MANVKVEAQQLLESLPDDASWEDIQYHLYVRQKIAEGMQAVREGRTLTQAHALRFWA